MLSQGPRCESGSDSIIFTDDYKHTTFLENCEHFDLHYITASIGNKLQDDFYQDSYIYLVSSKHKLMDRTFHFIKKVKSLCYTIFETSNRELFDDQFFSKL